MFLRPVCVTWRKKAEKVSSGVFENRNEKIVDDMGVVWRKVSKKDDEKTFMWIKESEIGSDIDTDKPVVEAIYNKWEQFFTRIDNLESFGKYGCDEGNEEKFLDYFNILYLPGNLDQANTSDYVNTNRGMLAQYYFCRETDWNTDEGLTKKYAEKSQMLE